MPFSVMMAEMYRFGVTSNAGFLIRAASGVILVGPTCVTSR
jgi:hypothetical protein